MKLRPVLCVLILVFSGCRHASDNATVPEAGESPVELVYPYLDAANARWFFFSSACRPFGMVNLSPDTQTGGAWGSGYRYHTDTIKGFSHIHAWQLAGVSVMPVTVGDVPVNSLLTDFSSPFSHDKETVMPGFHEVTLDRFAIKAGLTSTTRVGFHRYTFPGGSTPAVVFSLSGLLGPSEMKGGQLEQVNEFELAGKVTNAPTIRRPRDADVFFYVKFNVPVSKITLRKEGGEVQRALVELSGAGPVLMKVGISYTSREGARNNLEKELEHWDFDSVVNDSKAQWNRMLSRISIEGGTLSERRRFYTDLWHALQGRRIISDADGKYPDNAGPEMRVGRLPLDAQGNPRFNHFNSDSFWGAQWTLNTLWHLVYPEISEQFVNSLLQYYQDGGLIPRGPSGGNYTYVMTGASSTPFIVSAWMKGIRNFDIALAYEGLKKNHMPGGMMAKAGYEHATATGGGLEHYIEKGYVPFPLPEGEGFGFHQDGAGMTLEYAYQDWTLAQLAKELRHNDDYAYFMGRSKNYANLFDKETGWIRPKNDRNEWFTPFDPYDYEHGFVESNAAQCTWFVPHDLAGLAALMGGPEQAAARLNASFEEAAKLNFTSGTSQANERDPALRRIPINYGNQPSIQTAFIFNRLGRPDLTQYWGREVVSKVYSDLSPERGYSGDEDQGLMGSLAVLLKLGLFQLTGGCEADPVYEVGSPLFDAVTIKLNPAYYKGGSLRIEARQNSRANRYIKSAVLNGKPLESFSVKHSDLVKGGNLVLEMSDAPGRE